MQGFINA